MGDTLKILGSSIAPLPSFRNPPVNEVVCGVRFRPSDQFRIAHIGLLWDKFRKEYPKVQHVSPIASAAGELLVDASTGTPLPRVWFINETGDRLIQFQGDRFYFNWRRQEFNYPRYGNIINNFEQLVNNIINFNKEFGIGEIEPIEYELTYINHIQKGHGWHTLDDLPLVFKDFSWNHIENRFLPNPDKVAWNVSFLLPDDSGRLIVSLKHGIRKDDKMPLLLLELKTLGIDSSAKIEHYRMWFDRSREWIVRGFADLTTPEQHKIWEREDNG